MLQLRCICEKYKFSYSKTPTLIKYIKYLIPDKIKIRLKGYLFPNKGTWWKGDFKSWEKAQAHCTGYSSGVILEKVKQAVLKVKHGEALYERDSVLFNEPYIFSPFLHGLKASALDGKLHVTDFGGSLGSTFFQYRKELKHIGEIKWSVIEQPNYVAVGKKEIAEKELNFYLTTSEALQYQEPHLLILSSVLPYLEKPYETLKELVEADFNYILIDRTNFVSRKKDRLTVQRVPSEIYAASYPCWFFNEEKFLNVFSEKYEVITTFLNDIPPPERLGIDQVYWKGFYLKRKGRGK